MKDALIFPPFFHSSSIRWGNERVRVREKGRKKESMGSKRERKKESGKGTERVKGKGMVRKEGREKSERFEPEKKDEKERNRIRMKEIGRKRKR